MDRLDQTILVDYAIGIATRLAKNGIDIARLSELQRDYVSAAIVSAWHESNETDGKVCRAIAHELATRQFATGRDV